MAHVCWNILLCDFVIKIETNDLKVVLGCGIFDCQFLVEPGKEFGIYD